ncbi:MAG: segregation/condensation protein A [Clostridia bacterium]|nr:segregation/condensation protein A [Clostridia bacterium]
MNQIALKLQTFEGPLDLLLHLISKNKVSLYDIPIAKITEQYISYLRQMEQFDIEVSSEFLVVASNLLYIKSKMILPNEEEEELEDPREELALRLMEYKKMKLAADKLRETENAGQYMIYKERSAIKPVVIDESLKLVTKDSLLLALGDVCESIRYRMPVSAGAFKGVVGKTPISIFGLLKKFIFKLRSLKKLKFSDLFKGIKTREEAVASFLAVLEMAKMDRISIEDADDGYLIKYRERRKGK